MGLLYWTLRDVSIATVWHELKHSNVPLFAASAICATLIFPLRARRWQTILEPVAQHVPLGPLWRSTAIGMMLNNTFPARAGEVARAYALTRETQIPFSAALASLAVDRIFDAVTLLLLAFLALLDPAFPKNATIAGQSVSAWAMGGTTFVLVAMALLYGLVFFPTQIIKLFELFARKVSPTIESKGAEFLRKFSNGLAVMRKPGRFVAVLGWTVAHWLLNAFAFWLGFKAVGIAAPFSAAVLLQTLIGMGVAIPAAPGFFGVFEKLAVVGLAIYLVPAELATSWAIGFHILSFIPITIIGAYYFVKMGFKLKEIQSA